MTALPYSTATPAEVLAGLRVWAAGYRADVAAVELLGALAEDVPELLNPTPIVALPWLIPCPRPGVWALEGRPLMQAVNLFPKPIRPLVLAVARLLTDGDNTDAVTEVEVMLDGVRVGWLAPVFSALVEASGCASLLTALSGAQPPLTGLEAAA